MITPLGVLTAFERHIQSEVNIGLCTMSQACDHTMPTIVTRLRALSPSLEEATAALEYLHPDTGKFTLEQRQELSTVVKASMKNDTASQSKRTGWFTAQKHRYLHRYMPVKLWGVLFSHDTIINKMKHMAHFMCLNLGCRHPDAQTQRLAVVIVHVASQYSPDPTTAYNDVRTFSDIMDQKRTGVNSAPTMIDFPDDVEQFIKVYPTAFGEDDPPVKCRVDESIINERCRSDVTPIRHTNSMVEEHGKRKVRRVQKTPEVVDAPTPSPLTKHHSTVAGGDVNSALLGILERFMFDGKPIAPSHGKLGCTQADENPPRSSTSEVAYNGCHTLPITDQSASVCGGGIRPKCLEPLQMPGASSLDNLKRSLLGDDDAMVSLGLEKAGPESGEEPCQDDVEDKPLGKVMNKRPAAAVKKRPAGASSSTPSSAPKAAKTNATKTSKGNALEKKRAELRKLLKRKAAKDRPNFNIKTYKKPTHYKGGRIYFAKARRAYRVYRRMSDKVESWIPVNIDDKRDLKEMFQVGCALIEADRRPYAD